MEYFDRKLELFQIPKHNYLYKYFGDKLPKLIKLSKSKKHNLSINI